MHSTQSLLDSNLVKFQNVEDKSNYKTLFLRFFLTLLGRTNLVSLHVSTIWNAFGPISSSSELVPNSILPRMEESKNALSPMYFKLLGNELAVVKSVFFDCSNF